MQLRADFLEQTSPYQNLVQDVIALARQKNATAVEVSASFGEGMSANVRKGELDKLEFNQDKNLDVTVYFGHHIGEASTADLSPKAIAETVEKACAIAKYTEEDEYAALADPELMAYGYPDLDLYHHWELSPEQAIDLALSCEQAGFAYSDYVSNSEGAQVSSARAVDVYGNSHGFIGSYPSSYHSISCSLIAQKDGRMEQDYYYTAARDARNLLDPQLVGRMAAQRTVDHLGARRLKTQKIPVLYVAECARSLIKNFLQGISGGNLYRQTSFLLNSVGKQIFAPQINIIENPHLLGEVGSAPYDDEGVATHIRSLVTQGILNGYMLSSYSARRLGMQSTGNAGGAHNILVESGDQDFSQLVRTMDRGLIVTDLMGPGVDINTGNYSRGGRGYWVENGAIQYPVEEITVAGNLREMLANIVAVGNDVDKRGNIKTGSILLDLMMVAGEK